MEEVNDSEDDNVDDIIDDDYDSYDELFTQYLANEEVMRNTTKVQKPWRVQSPKGSTSVARKSTNTGKRFVLPMVSDHKSNNSSSTPPQAHRLPWAQQYSPMNLDELAVHKRKVSDVQSWLRNAFTGSREHVSFYFLSFMYFRSKVVFAAMLEFMS